LFIVGKTFYPRKEQNFSPHISHAGWVASRFLRQASFSIAFAHESPKIAYPPLRLVFAD
jgi:hypothetical protein